MSYPVTYYCPRCGTFAALQREGYLDDKAVTPYPFEGWTYVAPDQPFEETDADGVRFVCGESEADGLSWRTDPEDESPSDDPGCDEPFYLSFVRFEEGREIEPRPESEIVEIAPEGPAAPWRPGGPSGP